MNNSRLEVGGVARAHGIKGEVAIHTHDPDSDILGQVERVYIGGVEYAVEEARGTAQRGWLVALAGVTTRNDAEALQGKPVEIAREDLELEDGEVILHDLVGCECRLADGTSWGTVVAIDVGVGQDRLVVHAGGMERLLPIVDVFVTKIDLEARIVTVAPPEGSPETPV